ncbi:MAG: isopeptide-forming domain-containing fimbrial protein [Alistipes sp.]|nr:isopeptide-forming domain-containing fimbrial protein [Alistipes sp.]
MKNFKKLAAMVAALTLSACAIAPMASFAAPEETYSITVDNEVTGHTYDVYQIFIGDLSEEDGAKVLSNIKWGSGQESNKVGDDATEASKNITGDNALTWAKGLRLSAKPTATLQYDTTTKKYAVSGLVPGYYLVKDRDNSLSGVDDAYTSFILRVVGDATATPKSAKPTVDKEVYDNDDSVTEGDNNGWGETADHAINESFQFKLTATVPADADYAYYDTYKVVFNDEMSEGITFESIESVKVGAIDVPETGYTKTEVSDGKWSLTIDDILQYDKDLTDGATIEVVYNAHLNEKAYINKKSGTTENLNKVNLEYSNNPNVSGGGELGKTPDDTVWVFTYGVDNTKVDGSDKNAPLGGAGFKLYDITGATEIGLIKDGDNYRPIKSGETAVEMFSASDTGKFNIIGLDAGKYVLKETTVPAGYNKCADKIVVISATKHEETDAGASANVTLDMENSNLDNTIVNEKGSTLPSTGGMGTTLFYIVGGAMVAVGGIFLITKKRMSKDAE